MEGSPAERDVLLATKLQVPRSRSGLVPRRRLADRLEEGLNRGLVLVAAPAGYGKSVLLSEWVRGMTEPVAWLSLDGETTTRCGSGVTCWPLSTWCARASPSG